ncbi:MAG: PQQ-dependent sugar dehydrogenase [Microgenomates group bacterium]
MNKFLRIALPIILLVVGSILIVAVLDRDIVSSWFKYVSSDRSQPSGFVDIESSPGELQTIGSGLTSQENAENPLIRAKDLQISVETVVTDLLVPWSVVFTSSDRILITERSGAIRAVENGVLLESPLLTIAEVSSSGEEGLMGMVLDPDYQNNKYVYVCYAYPKDSLLVDAVLRLIDNGDHLKRDSVLIDDIPAAQFHAGCELGFGPDGMLYITTGDATDRTIAQSFDSLGGKILRVNADGTIPSDNPIAGSYIYSLGHRNPQGLAWHPENGNLYATEHGPSTIDGPPGGDEVNFILAGENYGWPRVSHQESDSAFIDPVLVFTPAVAPGSATFHDGTSMPQIKNNFFFAGLKGEGLFRVVFDPENPAKVLLSEKIPQVNVGRVREVIQGPEGVLYFTSSNRDGRGTIRDGDDSLYKLMVK